MTLKKNPLEQDVAKILLQPEQIAARVRELGVEISRDYEGKDLAVVCILKGALHFMADLTRHIALPLVMDSMAVSSYGSATTSSGVVRIIQDLDFPIKGRDVLLVEDIIDTGLTLKYLLETLQTRQPASLRVATLLDKPERRLVDIKPDYNGFVIPDEFVVGYGLDYAEKYRNLPFVGVLKPEVYEKEG